MFLSQLPQTNGVKFGDIFLKPKDVSDTASKSCRLVLFESQFKDDPLGYSGSSTLLKFRGKKYIALTRHQLSLERGNLPDQEILDSIRIASGDNTLTNIPLQNCIFETSHSDDEFHDLLFFEVADDWVRDHVEAPYFASVEEFNEADRGISYVFGCPATEDTMAEYLDAHLKGELGTIHIKTLVADCHIDSEFKSTSQYYKKYIGGPRNYTFDGLSGGPIYSLINGTNGYEFVFDGITVRGGNGNIYAVDASYIKIALSK